MSAKPTAHHMLGGTVRIFLADALVLPTGILTVAFLTRSLGPEGYGLFTLAAIIVGWTEGLLGTFFSRPTLKFIAEAADWRPLGEVVVKMHLSASLVATAIFWLASPTIAQLLQEPQLGTYLRLFALDMPLFALAHAHRNILIGTGAFRQKAKATAGHWITRLLMIVIFVELGLSVYGAILGSMSASLVQVLISRIYVRPPLWGKTRLLIPGFWTYAGPLSLFAIGASVLGRLDLLLLKGLGGTTSQSGIYGAAQNLTLVPHLFSMALSPLLLSTLSRLVFLGDLPSAKKNAVDAMRVTMLLSPFAAMTAGMSEEIVGFVYGTKFLAAAPLLAMLIFASLGVAMTSVATCILTAAGKPQQPVAFILPLLPLALVGHLLTIPRLGPVGAALVTTACAVVGATVFIIAVQRAWKILPPLGSFLRSLLISVLVFSAAMFWATPGPLLLLKILTITIFIAVAYWVLREFDASEIRLIRFLFQRSHASLSDTGTVVSRD